MYYNVPQCTTVYHSVPQCVTRTNVRCGHDVYFHFYQGHVEFVQDSFGLTVWRPYWKNSTWPPPRYSLCNNLRIASSVTIDESTAKCVEYEIEMDFQYSKIPKSGYDLHIQYDRHSTNPTWHPRKIEMSWP